MTIKGQRSIHYLLIPQINRSCWIWVELYFRAACFHFLWKIKISGLFVVFSAIPGTITCWLLQLILLSQLCDLLPMSQSQLPIFDIVFNITIADCQYLLSILLLFSNLLLLPTQLSLRLFLFLLLPLLLVFHCCFCQWLFLFASNCSFLMMSKAFWNMMKRYIKTNNRLKIAKN